MKDKTGRGEVEIVCPFYHRHNAMQIGCEGITDDSSIQLSFTSKAGRERQEKLFCCDRFECCEIYRAANEKYTDTVTPRVNALRESC